MSIAFKIDDPASIPPSIFMPDRAQARAALDAVVASCAGKVCVLCGAGGGADCIGTAIVYRRVKAVAKQVILVNLTFASTQVLNAACNPATGGCTLIKNVCYLVPPGLPLGSKDMFSDARYASALGQPVYAFPLISVGHIAESHEAILAHACGGEKPSPDELVLFLVDGGADILLRGTESGLATPEEDMCHLRAITDVYKNVKRCFICNIGADIDQGHGMVGAEMIQRIRDLKKAGALISAEVLTASEEDHPEAAFYCRVVNVCAPVFTIVQSLTVAAIEGHRGLYTPPHLVPRIRQNKVPLSDNTATFFLFDLWQVASQIGYLADLTWQDNRWSIWKKIDAFKQREADERHAQEREDNSEDATAGVAAAASDGPSSKAAMIAAEQQQEEK